MLNALGYQTTFDAGKSALTKHNLAMAYNAGDMIIHANDSKQFGAGVYLKNSPALETGITLATGGSGGNRFFLQNQICLEDDKSHAPPA